MKRTIRTILIIVLVYFVAAFSHWQVLWPSETSFMEDLAWAIAALYLGQMDERLSHP